MSELKKYPKINKEVVKEHGISHKEYENITNILDREPNYVELGIYSVMWSEHCSYKSTKKWLKTLPTTGKHVICGPGENAGVIDIGDDDAIVFKMESHNHPSFIEPYQGAATGVGGILRDVFTMGARPIANMNALRFGHPDHSKTRHLVTGVVSGIGGYGNCVGVPTVGGECIFHSSYDGNVLVNAMTVGIVDKDKIFYSVASGVGNPLVYVGSKTGRDGIHGATMASTEFTQNSDEKRPTVQVGDPFTEKLLIEACLELMATDAIVAIQDMGAAGITSSASEMAGRGGSGVELEMTDVPVREDGMTPYEILLSESQERMLVVAHPGREDEVREILEKWELEAAVIGQVTDDGKFRILENGNVVGDIPALPLTDGCPTYEREGIESEEVIALREMDLTEHMTEEGDLTKDFLLLLRSPNVASKRWIYEQYDTTVRTGTAVRPGGDSGVVRIRGTKRAIAATTDCNGRLVYLEPRTGAMAAVAEAARNLVCVGALPTAITNNLNFGNPLKTHIYYQLREAVLGMREACSAFETPVTGGNVSLFNETDGKAIYPTPVIGMVGVIDDVSKIIHHAFKSAGDDIVLLGTNSGEIGGSEYLYVTSKLVAGNPPSLDLEAERLLQQAVLKMNHEEVLNSAHDCSQGGLAATLAECALGNGETPLGVSAEVDEDLAPIVSLFGESHGRIIASTSPDNTERVLALAALYDVPAKRIGTVTDMASGFSIKVRSGSVQARMTDLAEAYFGSIPNIMDAPTGSEA